MTKLSNDYKDYMDYVNRVKTQGIGAVLSNPEDAAGMETEVIQKRLQEKCSEVLKEELYHPVLKALHSSEE